MSQSDKELIDLIRTTIGSQAAELVELRFDYASKYLDSARRYLRSIGENDGTEVWKLQFLTDVTTAACLVRHGKQCKGLADRLGDGSTRWRNELFDTNKRITELEPVSAAGVKDAERYQWLRDAFIKGLADDDSCLDLLASCLPKECHELNRAPSRQEFDSGVDAAMAKGVQS